MWNKLFSLCGHVSIMSATFKAVEDFVEHFDNTYVKDASTYNAAIDAVCEILQQHKTKDKQ